MDRGQTRLGLGWGPGCRADALGWGRGGLLGRLRQEGRRTLGFPVGRAQARGKPAGAQACNPASAPGAPAVGIEGRQQTADTAQTHPCPRHDCPGF